MTGARLELSTRALRNNITAVSTHIAPSELMLVMKDDAYGHGIDWAVAAASDIAWFGSYDVQSGLRIRALRSDARVFAWATSTIDEIDAALDAHLDLGVGSAAYLARIIACAEKRGTQARVHLKIDTGLHRNGIRSEDWPEFIATARAAEERGVLKIVGVWSHLSEASDHDDDESAAVFAHATTALRETGASLEATHLTASAASWWRPELRGSLCRIGAFCYGVRSAEGPEIPGVVPVATLTASIIEVRAVGDVVIDLGSFHGLPSTLAGATVGTPAGGKELRIVGAHESIVEGWAGAHSGDRVTLFGAGDKAEGDVTSLAERIDTVGEEVLLRVSPRVPRVVVD